jgi:hypothetical protein
MIHLLKLAYEGKGIVRVSGTMRGKEKLTFVWSPRCLSATERKKKEGRQGKK